MQAWLLGKPKAPTPEKRKKTLIWVRGPPKTGQDTDPATQPLLPTPRNLVLPLLMCLYLCSLPGGGTAIDFLLLAQSHGCEDVEGFCCFNLSDHSASIHKQLQWMQGHTQKIKMQADPFGEWLEGLFGELEPWLKQMLKTLIVGLAIFLAIMLCLPCFVQLLKACLRNFIEEISHQQYAYQRIQEQL